MNKKLTSATHIAVFVVYTMLTASIVSAQTGGGDDFTSPTLVESALRSQPVLEPAPGLEPPPGREPKYSADGEVCVFGDAGDAREDPSLARVCLEEAEVNTGLAEYAFVRTPVEQFGGAVESQGLVSRWAAAEALLNAVEQAGAALPDVDMEGHRAADIGWMDAGRQERMIQANQAGIIVGVDNSQREGTCGTIEGLTAGDVVLAPQCPLNRAQMALVFVRTLDYIQKNGGDLETDAGSIFSSWLGEELVPTFADIGESFVSRLKQHAAAAVLMYDMEVSFGAEQLADGRLLYRPWRPVTGDQMSRFMVRLLAHTSIRVDLTPSDRDRLVAEAEKPPPEASAFPSEPWALPLVCDEEKNMCEPEIPGRPPSRSFFRDPVTRPPVEFDYYLRQEETDDRNPDNIARGIYFEGTTRILSKPHSLQIGDWHWTQPPGEEHRYLKVLIGFQVGTSRTSNRFTSFWCWFPDETDGGLAAFTSKKGTIKGNLNAWSYYRVSSGVYQMEGAYTMNQGLWFQEPGACDLGPGGYDFPVPEGGYTNVYPCESGLRRINASRWTQWFPSCSSPQTAEG